jgi:hypothetical protein
MALSPDGRTLANGYADSTILLWDATLRGGARGGLLRAGQAESLWADLAGADAARGYAAGWRLADDPTRSVALLQERLQPIRPASPEEMRTLLGNLDSNQFSVRQAAERTLRELGERAEPGLRESLKGAPPLEVKRRVEALLEAIHAPGPLEGEALRGFRAVQVLERIGTADARRILEGLAKSVAGARLTQEARAALERLAKRAPAER